MRVGDVVKVTSLQAHFSGPEARGHAGYKAPKGEYFVVLLLGTEPRDGSAPLDPEAWLREHGWEFQPPATPAVGKGEG